MNIIVVKCATTCALFCVLFLSQSIFHYSLLSYYLYYFFVFIMFVFTVRCIIYWYLSSNRIPETNMSIIGRFPFTSILYSKKLLDYEEANASKNKYENEKGESLKDARKAKDEKNNN